MGPRMPTKIERTESPLLSAVMLQFVVIEWAWNISCGFSYIFPWVFYMYTYKRSFPSSPVSLHNPPTPQNIYLP